MRVVVPTPQQHCPASNALRMEGVEFDTFICSAPTDYGLMWTELWNAGDPFIVVEWDIVPWPGAVQKLIDTAKGWTTFAYPLNEGHLATSFGIGKYVPVGTAPSTWADTAWDRLDGAVIPVLRDLYRVPFVLNPPVAHARREVI